MQKKVIKLRDKDGEYLHPQYFCPECHFWLMLDYKGVEYCPNCGTHLIWDWDQNRLQHLREWRQDISIEEYERLTCEATNKN